MDKLKCMNADRKQIIKKYLIYIILIATLISLFFAELVWLLDSLAFVSKDNVIREIPGKGEPVFFTRLKPILITFVYILNWLLIAALTFQEEIKINNLLMIIFNMLLLIWIYTS